MALARAGPLAHTRRHLRRGQSASTTSSLEQQHSHHHHHNNKTHSINQITHHPHHHHHRGRSSSTLQHQQRLASHGGAGGQTEIDADADVDADVDAEGGVVPLPKPGDVHLWFMDPNDASDPELLTAGTTGVVEGGRRPLFFSFLFCVPWLVIKPTALVTHPSGRITCSAPPPPMYTTSSRVCVRILRLLRL